ncbi:G-protein coupled receptor 183-like [Brachyhypopomus gauderio]|uniref:G-protein coupled receptor 183-like n=1 Tax=Brachyhypopomus gauderio TaxID=698409 RepID=UPI00404172A2
MSFAIINSSSSSSDTDAGGYWCSKKLAGPLIWSVFSVFCFLLGFPSSIGVLYVLYRRRRHTVFSDGIFSLSMTVVDLILTSTIPFSVCNYMIWNSMEYEWICNFILSFTLTGRPLFMACVCGDCFFAVVYPIAYKTSKKIVIIKKAISITVWLIVLSFGSVIASVPWVFSSPWSSTFILTALFIIALCDISILQALKKPDPSRNVSIHPQKKRALQIIRVSCVMTFVTYLPPAVLFSFGTLMNVDEVTWSCGFLFYGCCLTMAGCVIMPIVYLVKVEKLDIVKKWWKK